MNPDPNINPEGDAMHNNDYSRPASQGILIELPLTHQAIAEVIGIFRMTVTRVLETFEQGGLIVRLRRHIIILPDRCREVAV